MATKIVTKNSSTASAVPTASDLVQGELAVNVADKRLFTEDNAGAIVELGTNPTTLTVTGEITANGGIALGDGDVATFGDSDDLSIFHAGGTTYLTNTTGSLVLRTDSFRVLNTANSEQILHGDANGAVTAYYDNSVKLATTSTGIDVTGTATMDGLTVSGPSVVATINATGTNSGLQFTHGSTNTGVRDWSIRSNSNTFGDFVIKRESSFGSGIDTTTMALSSNGDISFYEDTGTTPKLVWSAAAESLTIPEWIIHDGNTSTKFGFGSANTMNFISNGSDRLTIANSYAVFNEAGTDYDFRVESNNNTHMLFVDGGNDRVGIGTSSPNAKLTVNGITTTGTAGVVNANSGDIVLQNNRALRGDNVSGTSALKLIELSLPDNDIIIGDNAFSGSGKIRFHTDATERMRIDASGNVGIGVTNPGAPLDIGAASPKIRLTDTGGGYSELRGNGGVMTLTADAGNTVANSAVTFETDGTERMRISSAGHTTFGTTDLTPADNSVNGTSILSDGRINHNAQSQPAAVIGRTGTDGAIADFRKSGLSVGSIGANTGGLYIADAGVGFRFDSGGTDDIIPCNATGGAADGTINLGSTGARFKDLYLSGSAIVGGLQTNTAGISNFVAGVNAGNSIIAGGNYNTVVGDEAGTAITTGERNTAVGTQAAVSTTTGTGNTATGYKALENNTVGSSNTALGQDTLRANTASNNTAVGFDALTTNTTGSLNSAVGSSTLVSNTTGANNVAMGFAALQLNTTASNNTALGYAAMNANTTGRDNTAVGFSAATSNTTGLENTAIGMYALRFNTTGEQNTAVGLQALHRNTTANNNTAVGRYAMEANTTGSENTALGKDAGAGITSGASNVALGFRSLYTSNTASKNVAIGDSALRAFSGSGNAENVAIGDTSGTAITSGSGNTLVGGHAGDTITSGVRHICVGLDSGATLTTGNDSIFIGHGAAASTGAASSQIALGNVTCVGNGNFTFGSGSNDSNIQNGATSITAPSDERFKEEVADSTAGLAFINDLRPVTYKWKKEKDLPTTMDAYVEGSEKRVMNDNTNHGFIAQEVKAAIDAHPELKDGFDMWMEKDSDGQQRVAPSALVPMLVKAIQELTARIEELEG